MTYREKTDYTKFASLEKGKRRQKAADSGILDGKRFTFSRSPEIKRRVDTVRGVFPELQQAYPGLVSLHVFGSSIRGYANEESDLDIYGFVKREEAEATWNTLNDEEKKKYRNPDVYYKQHIQDTINRHIDSDTEPANVLYVSSIDEESIKEDIERSRFLKIKALFLPAIGDDVYTYRSMVFDTLEEMGGVGEQWWKDCMERLCQFENKGLTGADIVKRRKLYPQTIVEGKEYFLRGQGRKKKEALRAHDKAA